MVICFPRKTLIQSDAGARRLQILVSSTSVVWDGKYLNMLIQVSLKAVHKEICQKKRGDADLTEISFRGQFKLEPHPHWPPLGV